MSESIISLLIELQRLKGLDRTGWVLRGLANGTESVQRISLVSVDGNVIADKCAV